MEVVRQWKQVETSVLSWMEFTPFMDIYGKKMWGKLWKTYFNSICLHG